jgi:electron transfer flavoprotein alpha subunit
VKEEARFGEISSLSVDIRDLRTTVNNVVRKASEGVDLTEANVIVAGGCGVKSKEGFEPLKRACKSSRWCSWRIPWCMRHRLL